MSRRGRRVNRRWGIQQESRAGDSNESQLTHRTALASAEVRKKAVGASRVYSRLKQAVTHRDGACTAIHSDYHLLLSFTTKSVRRPYRLWIFRGV
jgi:hypothetical protein